MKTLGSYVRVPTLLATAGVLFLADVARAALPTTNTNTGESPSGTVWICVAGFVLGTLGLAFWNSKRRETE